MLLILHLSVGSELFLNETNSDFNSGIKKYESNVVKANESPGMALWNSLNNNSFSQVPFYENNNPYNRGPYQGLGDWVRINNGPAGGHGTSIITELRDEVNGQIRVVAIAYGDAFIYDEASNRWIFQFVAFPRGPYNNNANSYYGNTLVSAVKFGNRVYYVVYWSDVNGYLLVEMKLANGRLSYEIPHIVRNGQKIYKFYFGVNSTYTHAASIAVLENKAGSRRLAVYAFGDNVNSNSRWVQATFKVFDENLNEVRYKLRYFPEGGGYRDIEELDHICLAGSVTHHCYEEIETIFSTKSPNNEFFVGYISHDNKKIKFLNVSDGLDIVHTNHSGTLFRRLNPYAIVNFNHSLYDGDSVIVNCSERYASLAHANVRSDGYISLSVVINISCAGNRVSLKIIELKLQTATNGSVIAGPLFHVFIEHRIVINRQNDPGYVIDGGRFFELVIDGVGWGSIYSFYNCRGTFTSPSGQLGHSPVVCAENEKYGFKMAYQWTNPGWGVKNFPRVPTIVGYLSERLGKLFVGNANSGGIRSRTTFDVKGIWVANIPIGRNECTISISGSSRLSVNNTAVNVDVSGYSRRAGNGRLVVSRAGFNNYEKQAAINRASDGYFVVRITLTLDEIDQRFTGSSSGTYTVKLQFFLPDNQGCVNNLNVDISVVPPPRSNSCQINILNQRPLYTVQVSGFSRIAGGVRLEITKPGFNLYQKPSSITLRDDGYFSVNFALSLQELEDRFWDLTGNNYNLSFRFILPDNQTSCQTTSTIQPYTRPRVNNIILQCNQNNPNNPYSISMNILVSPSDYPSATINEVFVIFDRFDNVNFNSPIFNYNFVGRSFSINNQSYPLFAQLSRNRSIFGNGGGIANLSGSFINDNSYIINVNFNVNNGFQNINQINSFIENGFRIVVAVSDTSGRVNLEGLQPTPPQNVEARAPLFSNMFRAVDTCNPLMQVTTNIGDIGDYGAYTGVRIDRVAFNPNSNNSSISASLTGPLIISDFVYENVSNICSNNNVRLRVSSFCRNVMMRTNTEFLNIPNLINSIRSSVDQSKQINLNLSSGSVLNLNSALSGLNNEKKIIFVNLNSSGNLIINDNLNEVRQPLIVMCTNCINLFINQVGVNQVITGANIVGNSYQLNVANNSINLPKRLYLTNGNIYLGDSQQPISGQPQYFVGAFVAGGGLYTARTYSATGIFGLAYSRGVVARGKTDGSNLSNTNADIIFRHFAGLNNTFPLLTVRYDPWYKFWIEQFVTTDQYNKKKIILGI